MSLPEYVITRINMKGHVKKKMKHTQKKKKKIYRVSIHTCMNMNKSCIKLEEKRATYR